MTPDEKAKKYKIGQSAEEKKPLHLRLMELNEEQIKELNAYQLLGLDEPARATPYTIKQAYRRASIKYHPDKTGRDVDTDYVFIAIKAAHETLSDPVLRKAYDSTEMPFDDSIPPDVANDVADIDFYDMFGPVFERNLRFDTRLQVQTSKKAAVEIPSLGNEQTSIEEVQAFYGTLAFFSRFAMLVDCVFLTDRHLLHWRNEKYFPLLTRLVDYHFFIVLPLKSVLRCIALCGTAWHCSVLHHKI